MIWQECKSLHSFLSKKRDHVLWASSLKKAQFAFSLDSSWNVSRWMAILNFPKEVSNLKPWWILWSSTLKKYTSLIWLESRRENAFGLVFIIWNRSEEMHSVPSKQWLHHSVCYTAAWFLMFVQERHSGESFGAVFALIFLYIRMGLEVSPQIWPVCKCSVAMRAWKRLLPSVSSNVSLKQPGSWECLATDLADTR